MSACTSLTNFFMLSTTALVGAQHVSLKPLGDGVRASKHLYITALDLFFATLHAVQDFFQQLTTFSTAARMLGMAMQSYVEDIFNLHDTSTCHLLQQSGRPQCVAQAGSHRSSYRQT